MRQFGMVNSRTSDLSLTGFQCCRKREKGTNHGRDIFSGATDLHILLGKGEWQPDLRTQHMNQKPLTEKYSSLRCHSLANIRKQTHEKNSFHLDSPRPACAWGSLFAAGPNEWPE